MKSEFLNSLQYLCFISLSALVIFSCIYETVEVSVGLDHVESNRALFRGKRIGIISNHTGYDSQDRSIVEVFHNLSDVDIAALFGPEHGFSGLAAAGEVVSDTSHGDDEIPVYSLYGRHRKPTAEMLEGIDLMVYDIQDIGTRYYTYISTMALAMEAAAENGIGFVVLDRPNPLNGLTVEGNILDTTFSSFVGMFPIPVRHGMTSGELARLINSNGWLAGGVTADLKVIPMSGWQRHMWYDQTGLTWRPPSPNMPDLHTATVYPGMCLLEGTNLSEGRGTYQPFLRCGAPWVRPADLELINKTLEIPGLLLAPVNFTPRPIPEMAPQPKFINSPVQGLSLMVREREKFQPYRAGIMIVKFFHDQYPEHFSWKKGHFDRLCGTNRIRGAIGNRQPLDPLLDDFTADETAFAEIRRDALLY